MLYKNLKRLIKDLGCDELQFEDKKIHERHDIKADREVIERLREFGITTEEHFDKEVCLNCGLKFEDCPIKNHIKKELEGENGI